MSGTPDPNTPRNKLLQSNTIEMTSPPSGEAAPRRVKVRFTTGDRDRDGEIIVPGGLKTDAYMKNPIVLFNHDRKTVIAKTVGLSQEANAWVADVEFPKEGEFSESDHVYKLIRSGLLNTASIGARYLKGEWLDDTYVITSSEMYEFSFVTIPANPNAVIVERAMTEDDGFWDKFEARMKKLLGLSKTPSDTDPAPDDGTTPDPAAADEPAGAHKTAADDLHAKAQAQAQAEAVRARQIALIDTAPPIDLPPPRP